MAFETHPRPYKKMLKESRDRHVTSPHHLHYAIARYLFTARARERTSALLNAFYAYCKLSSPAYIVSMLLILVTIYQTIVSN